MIQLPSDPFSESLGARIMQLDEGRAEMSVAIGSEHINAQGAVHGGVMFTLTDTCMGAALYSIMKPGDRCATVSASINFMKSPMGAEKLTAVAEVVHCGRSVATLKCEIRAEDGVLYSIATGSFNIARG